MSGDATLNTVMRGKCKLCLLEADLPDSHLLPKAAYRLIQKSDGDPPVIMKSTVSMHTNEQIVDGRMTIQRFLRAGLIQRLIITHVPVLIGDGIPLFGTLPQDVWLRHIATRHYRSKLVQSAYQVAA